MCVCVYSVSVCVCVCAATGIFGAQWLLSRSWFSGVEMGLRSNEEDCGLMRKMRSNEEDCGLMMRKTAGSGCAAEQSGVLSWARFYAGARARARL